jgi:PKD domain
LNITGVLYAPAAPLDIAGSGGLSVNPDSTYGLAEVIVSDLKDTGSGCVTINVDRPTVTIGTPFTTVVPGEPVPLVIQASDASSLAQAAAFTFTISFGDGDTRSVSGKTPLVVNHVYTKTGTYTVNVTATDEFGNTSLAATLTIKVVTVAVETDPFNAKETALFVGGTTGNDTIKFAASGKSGISVTLNGVSEGVYSTTGPLIVFGEGGTDTISEPGLANPSYLIENLSNRQHRVRSGQRSPSMGRPDRRNGDPQRLMGLDAFPGSAREALQKLKRFL